MSGLLRGIEAVRRPIPADVGARAGDRDDVDEVEQQLPVAMTRATRRVFSPYVSGQLA